VGSTFNLASGGDKVSQTEATHNATKSVDTEALLKPREYHEALGGKIGINSLYSLIRAGRIRHIRVGRKILIPKTELENWLEREAGEAR
jgi:excisionase family DNA binding protein